MECYGGMHMNDEIEEKILWCGRQKKGIKFGVPNENLCKAYLKKAETSLRSMQLNYQEKINEWAVDAAYYARYQVLYGLLQKCGITCEIHDCSLLLFRSLFLEYFDESLFTELETAKQQRIDLTYYTSKIVPEEAIKKNINSAPNFVLKLQEVIAKIDSEKSQKIQNTLKEILAKEQQNKCSKKQGHKI